DAPGRRAAVAEGPGVRVDRVVRIEGVAAIESDRGHGLRELIRAGLRDGTAPSPATTPPAMTLTTTTSYSTRRRRGRRPGRGRGDRGAARYGRGDGRGRGSGFCRGMAGDEKKKEKRQRPGYTPGTHSEAPRRGHRVQGVRQGERTPGRVDAEKRQRPRGTSLTPLGKSGQDIRSRQRRRTAARGASIACALAAARPTN